LSERNNAVNESQKKDPRSWGKWDNAGAVCHFRAALLDGPNILASSASDTPVFHLRPPHDIQRVDRRYSFDYAKGDGSREKPFEYVGAAGVSPRYTIIDLWARFRRLKGKRFLRVYTYVFEITPQGLITEDGSFTRLLPSH